MTKGKKATKKSMKAAVQAPPTEDSPGPAPSEESPLVQELRLQLQQTQSDLQEKTQKLSDSENKATAFSRQAEAERAAFQNELVEKDNTIQFLQGQLQQAQVMNLTLHPELSRKAEEQGHIPMYGTHGDSTLVPLQLQYSMWWMIQELRLQLQQAQNDLQEQTQKLSHSENKATAFSRQAEAERAAVQKELVEKDTTIQFLKGQLEQAQNDLQKQTQKPSHSENKATAFSRQVEAERAAFQKELAEKDTTIQFLKGQLEQAQNDLQEQTQKLSLSENTVNFLQGNLENVYQEEEQGKLNNECLLTVLSRRNEEYLQLSEHNQRLQQDLRREQEEKRAMQVELAQEKENCRHLVQALKESESVEAHLEKQANEAKTQLRKHQAGQTDLQKNNNDLRQALQKEQQVRQALQASQTDLLKGNNDLRRALQKEQEARQALQAQEAKMDSASHQQRQATEEAEAKGKKLVESLEAERATVKALRLQLSTEKATFKEAVQRCSHMLNSTKGKKEELVQNLEQLRRAHHNEEQKLQQTIQELSAALQSSEEEKKSVLLRSVELETSLRATEDRLQDTTSRMEELQAISTAKKWKWWQWFF